MDEMLQSARRDGRAVGAFNVLDYNSMRAVVRAAEELESPVIVQTSVKTVEFWGASTMVDWARELAGGSRCPVALHLDHCRCVASAEQCIEAGWTSVMFDGSFEPFERHLASTKRVSAVARKAGASVEAELGTIVGVEDDSAVLGADAHLADPAQAREFCAQLDLSAFAPAIGTAHGVYKGEPKIAFDRLGEIARSTGVPIALHGGTGLSDDVFRRCIALGCAKINISTALKHAFVDGFVEPHLAQPKYDPLKLLDSQFERVRALVCENVRLFGARERSPQPPR